MPVNLNLLPPEHAVSKSLSGFLKTVRALGVIGIAAFLVFGMGIGAIFAFSTVSLNGINTNITKLKGQVSALQKSEQQIILVKDRIKKIASIQKLPNSIPNLTLVAPTLVSIDSSGSVDQMTIDPGAIGMSANFGTNAGVTSFIESLQSSKDFKSIDLVSFNFNPTTGYAVEIKAVSK